jgi:predicted PurR-regulated permease PerM
MEGHTDPMLFVSYLKPIAIAVKPATLAAVAKPMAPAVVLTGLTDSNPGITPNSTGIPGLATLQNIAGGLLTAGLIGCVAGIVIAAICWALGSHNGNSRLAMSGRNGVLVGLAAALIVGGADALVTFFSGMGAGL